MAQGNNAAAIAAQVEAIRPDLETNFLLASVVWGRMEARTDLTPVSSRPTRVPFNPIGGGRFGVGNFDGSDMGTGTGPQEVPGYLPCASYLQASQYTAEAEWATDSSTKAVQNYVTLTHEQALQTMAGYMDVLVQMDGSNTIDTIVNTVAGGIVVNNANFFQSNQYVDIWTAVGGAFVATVQIQSEEVNTNTIWLTGPVPNGVTAGMVLMVNGASGQANTGVFGFKYYNVGSNVGNFMGIPRASYPGRFTAQNINLGNASLTPAIVRSLENQIILNMGQKAADKTDPVAHCNVDMKAAWENNALTVQSIDMAQLKGDQSVDMLKRNSTSTMGGRPTLINPRATPGRIDMIDTKNFWRLEIKPTDYYEVGGQTLFPLIGNSGGIQSASIFYLVWSGQLGMTNPRLSSYISNAAIPRTYFGR